MYLTHGSMVSVNNIHGMTDSNGGKQNFHMIENPTKTTACRGTKLNISQVIAESILCTIDVTNIYWFNYLNTSVNHYIYLHNNPQHKPRGFYVLHISQLTGHMSLMQCSHSPACLLCILSTIRLYIKFHINQFNHVIKLEANRDYNDYDWGTYRTTD